MIHVILNPNAGTNSAKKRGRIESILVSLPNVKVWKTERENHATELAQKAVAQGAERVIAIGGDGTINEVASALLYTSVPLGIIPMGSGNGLARHLEIPLSFHKALEKALSGDIITIDAGKWNDRPFFCTAGIGFDATVAAHFAKRAKRGFVNYVYSTLLCLSNYKPIEIKGKGPLYSFTVANANQFGNNAYISPESDLQDGELELIEIKPATIFDLGILGISLFRKNLHRHPLVTISSVKSISIQAIAGIPYHLDGESLSLLTDQIEISILPAALQVIK